MAITATAARNHSTIETLRGRKTAKASQSAASAGIHHPP